MSLSPVIFTISVVMSSYHQYDVQQSKDGVSIKDEKVTGKSGVRGTQRQAVGDSQKAQLGKGNSCMVNIAETQTITVTNHFHF